MNLDQLLKVVQDWKPTQKDRDDLVARLKAYDEEFERESRARRVTEEFLNRRIDL